MSNVIMIRATGNAASDTANIQGAADQLTEADYDNKNPGTVILGPGDYRINEPLVFGEISDSVDDPYASNVLPPRFVTAGTANLSWEGDETSDYMISYFSRARRHVGLFLGGGLCLWGNEKCRGVRAQGATYGAEVNGISINYPREIGFDSIDCWGGAYRNIQVLQCDGIPMRLTNFYSGLLDTIKLYTGPPSASWSFPATDDDTVWDYHGARAVGWVQTPAERRAGLVIDMGDNLVVNNLIMENINYRTEGAGISIHDYKTATFNEIRWEGCWLENEMVRVSGNSCRLRLNGHGNQSTTTYDHPDLECLVRATGDNADISVEGWQIKDPEYAFTKGVLLCDGGSHAGHRVANAGLGRPPLTYRYPLDQYIVTENNPTMSGKICADSDHSVSIPWQ